MNATHFWCPMLWFFWKCNVAESNIKHTHSTQNNHWPHRTDFQQTAKHSILCREPTCWLLSHAAPESPSGGMLPCRSGPPLCTYSWHSVHAVIWKTRKNDDTRHHRLDNIHNRSSTQIRHWCSLWFSTTYWDVTIQETVISGLELYTCMLASADTNLTWANKKHKMY